jgi:hypothetical protein
MDRFALVVLKVAKLHLIYQKAHSLGFGLFMSILQAIWPKPHFSQLKLLQFDL